MAKVSRQALKQDKGVEQLLRAILADLTALKTSVDSLKTLADANKAAINATHSKLDSDGGVTDTNYASANDVSASDATAMSSLNLK